MRSTRATLAVAACALAASWATVALLPASAAANSATAGIAFSPEELSGTGFVAQFQVPGAKKGQSLAVSTYRRSVSVVSGIEGLTTYIAPGRASRRGVAASFGRFGSLELSFEADGRPKLNRPPRRCSGEAQRYWKGTYTGSFLFRPKGGLPHVQRRHLSVEGTLLLWPKWHCGGGGGGDAGPQHSASGRRLTDERGVLLEAVECGRRGFSANGMQAVSELTGPLAGDAPRPTFSSFFVEEDGGVSIRYQVSAFSNKGLFHFDGGLTQALVRPPPPFHGSATLSTDPATGIPTWSGDLSVSLPGKRVALTAPGVNASIESFPVFEGGFAVTVFDDCA